MLELFNESIEHEELLTNNLGKQFQTQNCRQIHELVNEFGCAHLGIIKPALDGNSPQKLSEIDGALFLMHELISR